jgi:4'-phosphopantetheinyl transferase
LTGRGSIPEFFHIMKRKFTNKEWETIRSFNDEWTQLDMFYRNWVQISNFETKSLMIPLSSLKE